MARARGWGTAPSRALGPAAAPAHPAGSRASARSRPQMGCGSGLWPRASLLLALLALPGDGNEGSVAGSCHCDHTVPSGPCSPAFLKHVRRHARGYSRCALFTRFELRSQSVCGGSGDQWVLEVVNCLDRGECGHAYQKNLVHQKSFASPDTLIPRPTEGKSPDRSIPAWKYPPSALQPMPKPTLLPGTFSLDKRLTHLNETTTPIVGYGLEAGHRAEENQQELEEKADATGVTSPVVVGISVIVLVTGVILYIICKKKKQPGQLYIPGVIDAQA